MAVYTCDAPAKQSTQCLSPALPGRQGSCHTSGLTTVHAAGQRVSQGRLQLLLNTVPSVLWRCWLGDRKGIWPVKSWVLVCRSWWWWFDWSFACPLAPVVLSLANRLTQVHLKKWPLKRRQRESQIKEVTGEPSMTARIFTSIKYTTNTGLTVYCSL